MGQARTAIENLKGMVTNAERSGALSRVMANAFWDVVGGRPAAGSSRATAPVVQDREINVRLRVSGTSRVGGREINAEVERALSGIAGRAGLAVTRGSVTVTGV